MNLFSDMILLIWQLIQCCLFPVTLRINLQVTGQTVSQKIFKQCKPPLRLTTSCTYWLMDITVVAMQ